MQDRGSSWSCLVLAPNRLYNNDVCKKAFCAIHVVSKKRVEILASHIRKNKSTTPQDMRGRHSTRPNAISDEIVNQINCHIKRYPRRSSHYSRTKNLKRYYLSPELNIKKMYELYLESYEPEIYKSVENTGKLNVKPVVTYDFFFRYFQINFSNYSFGQPRSDTCQLCDKLDNKLKIKGQSEELNSIKLQKTIHLKRSSVFMMICVKKASWQRRIQRLRSCVSTTSKTSHYRRYLLEMLFI